MPKRILVLGGNGFIGSHLVQALAANGAYVRVLAKAANPSAPFVQGVEYRYADFAEEKHVSECLAGIDTVIHLVSTTVPATSNLAPIADITGNLLPTVKLLELMVEHGVFRIVFLSSGGTVYGNAKTIPVPEDHARNPVSSYGIVKVAIENYISAFSLLYGVKPLIIRASNPYGLWQGHLGVQGVISTFFERILSGKIIQVWGDGRAVKDYIYIDDLIAFIVLGISSGLEGIFNVGSGEGTTLREILAILGEITGCSPRVEYQEARVYDVHKVILDISKAKTALNWSPAVSLREGCKRYWDWAKG